MRVYPILKSHYVDFDVNREDVIAVAYTKDSAEAKCQEFNQKLTDQSTETKYIVGKSIPLY